MRYDDAFANGKYIEGAEGYPPRWTEKAAQFRTALGVRARLGLPYGKGERNWFDLYLPEGEPEGLLVFIHGGYWRAFSPREFSHLAAGAIARGWACATPAYTLAPGARINAITAEIAASLPVMAAEVAGPIVLTGHSAGGHLAARMVCRDIALPDDVATRLTRSVPISPLTDLRPLIETAMNDDFRLTRAEAVAESPALLTRRSCVPVHVWVGGSERPSFLDQARRLGNSWACPVTVDAGRHHFDVIEGLEGPDTPLMAALIG
jgi:acetyl esterase/lipase